jgi:hypothetical protein
LVSILCHQLSSTVLKQSQGVNTSMREALGMMKHVKSLRLSPVSEAGLYPVSTILKKLHTIKKLHVDLETFETIRLFSDMQAEVVPKLLFKHILSPKEMAPKIQLTYLRLWGVNLLGKKE